MERVSRRWPVIRSLSILAVVMPIAVAAPPSQTDRDTVREQTAAGPFREFVDVSRVVIEARPVDRHGRLLRGLDAGNFRIWVDGEPVEVMSAEWVLRGRPDVEPDAGAVRHVVTAETEEALPRPGRTILLFFQRDALHSRMSGLMKAAIQAERFVNSLHDDDRVAIFVHDTDLRMHSDLSGDKSWLGRILRDTVVRHRPPPPIPDASRAAGRLAFDPAEGYDVTNGDEALLLVARAVRHLPGTKSMLFFSWGLGRMYGGTVHLGRDYGRALKALLDARVSVFSLDFTQVDYHSLEGPLERVAEDTGGFYKKTFYSTIFAVDSVSRAIEGHYEIAFRRPDGEPGRHDLRVRLSGVRGNVYHRPFYVDGPRTD